MFFFLHFRRQRRRRTKLPFRYFFSSVLLLVLLLLTEAIAAAGYTRNGGSSFSRRDAYHRQVQRITLQPTTAPVGSRIALLPIDKEVQLFVNSTTGTSISQTLSTMDLVLEDYLKESFQEEYQDNENVNLFSIDMDVLLVASNTNDANLRLVRIVGQGVVQLRGQTIQPETVQTYLDDTLLTPAAIQRALEDTGINILVDEEDEATADTDDQDEDITPGGEDENETDDSTKPELWELILGFSLVGAGLLSLVYLVYKFHRKRRKAEKKKKLQSVRQMQSYVISNNNHNARSFDPASVVSRPPPPMAPSPIRPQPATAYDDDDDPFGQELQRAAQMDQQVWHQYQEQRRSKSADSRSSTQSHRSLRSLPTYLPNYEYSQKEPAPFSAYGDENPTPSTILPPPQRTVNHDAPSYNEAIEMTLSPSFDVYGDEKKTASLQDSWDLDKYPVMGTATQQQPSQFSFVYPMRRQPISDVQQPQHTYRTASPRSMSSNSEDAMAIRGSPTVSSWSTLAGMTAPVVAPSSSQANQNVSSTNMNRPNVAVVVPAKSTSRGRSPTVRQAPPASYSTMMMMQQGAPPDDPTLLDNLPDSEDDSSSSDNASVSSETFKLSTSLLKEVERLSTFVKSYETKKSASRSNSATRQRRVISKDEEMANLDVMPAASGESEVSHRLGIGRFKATSDATPPPAMLMTMHEYNSPSPLSSSLHQRRNSEPDSDAGKPLPPRGFMTERGRSPQSRPITGGGMDPSISLSSLPFDEAQNPDSKRMPRRSPPPGEPPSLRRSEDAVTKTAAVAAASTAVKDKNSSSQARVAAYRPEVKSKNKGFTNIISMFESKPKTSVLPPSENWQYEK